LIYLCLMGEAFFGYLLPWGQMSYWGAQVIVNLFSSIPFIGPDLAVWIRGDYVVSDATLNRFFALHVIALPLALLGLVVVHLLALHDVGSNNPDGVEIKKVKGPDGKPLDGIPFHPYYTVKDIVGVVVFLAIFCVVMFFAAAAHPAEGVVRVEEDRHLSGGGHGENFGPGQTERPGSRTAGTRREELHRGAVPRGSVYDRLAVGGEPSGEDASLPERELAVGRLARRRARPQSHEVRREERSDHGGRRQGRAQERCAARRNSPAVERAGRHRARGYPRQCLELERQIAGRLEALLGTLLQTVLDDPIEAGRQLPVQP